MGSRGAFRLLRFAGACYSIAWVGLVHFVFSHGEMLQVMSVTITSVLLGLISTRFSSVLGELTRVVFLVQMLSVIIGLISHGEEWKNFAALLLTFGMMLLLSVNLYDTRKLIVVYRTRRRQARLQQRLRLKNAALAELSSSKSRLLAMASHDLRQPVQALGLLVDSLRCDPASRGVRERVEVINGVVEELSKTLEKLMALAMFDAGTVSVNLESVALDKLFVSLLDEFEPLALRKGLTLKCEFGGLFVHTDATLLRTMMSNLLANAIRYSKHGSVRVAANVTSDKRTVRIQISDNGVGIATERITDIFEAFVRLGFSETGSEGLGLGLAITRRSADLLGIIIDVQSEVGKGTVFSLSLPQSLIQPATISSLADNPSNLQGLRVLIMDDDKTVLSSMAQSFEEWGCRVIVGSTADDAQIKVGLIEENLDLIITDYHLGSGLTGIDVIQSIREKFGVNVPAIILTGDVAIRSQCEAAESFTVVSHKPLSPVRLKALAIKAAALGRVVN